MAGLLLLLGFGVHANALRNPFQIDDTVIILGDHRVQEGRIGELLTGPYWPPPRQEKLYRPVVKASYALNWSLSHQAWTFRLPNLVLHVATAFALFLLARDLLGSFVAGLVAAVVFTVHPVHTEPLNAIVGRADLGAAAFGLLAVWLYWRDGARPAGTGWARPALAAACFTVAILCKESALPVVAIVVLLDVCPPRTAQHGRSAGWLRRRALRCYVPLLLVVAVYLAARFAVLGALVRGPERIDPVDNVIANPDPTLGAGDSRWLARWGTPLVTLAHAARLMIWPHPLCWDYSYAAIEPVKRVSDPRLWAGLVCVLALGAAMAVSFRRKRVVLASLGIGLIAYSVVSNTLIVIGTVFAERLLYLPSVGFCLLIGALVDAGTRRMAARSSSRASPRLATRWPVIAVLVPAVGVYGALTVDRNQDWHSRRQLDAADVQTHPRSCRLLSSMASHAVDAGDWDSAESYACRALAVYTDHPGPWKSLGAVHAHRGEPDQALECLRRCFELGGAGDEAAMVLATTLMTARGDYAQAIRLLTDFVAKYPLATTARNNLAWYLLTAEPASLRDPRAALVHAQAAMRMLPGQAEVVDTYVAALLALDRRDEARRVLTDSLRTIPPDSPYRAAWVQKLQGLQTP